MASQGAARKALRSLYRGCVGLVPRNRAGDRLVAFANFVLRHRRLPTRRMLFNDMLYRIKTTDEILDPLRVRVSDKELVKTYVREKVGDGHNVPTIAVLRSPGEVDSYDFPPVCCIKPTQASGHTILRLGGEPVDRERIKSWFALDHYAYTREANYRDLEPKIIVEPLIFGGGDLRDYKFFCVDGAAKLVQVDVDRHTDHKRCLLLPDWTPQDYGLLYPKTAYVPERPANFGTMIEVAEKLAAPFGFVRVDLYSDGASCLVGEITHCHGSASEPFHPRSAEWTASQVLFGQD